MEVTISLHCFERKSKNAKSDLGIYTVDTYTRQMNSM